MRAWRVVCFDLGGVLIQIHHSWQGAIVASGILPSVPAREYGALGGFTEFERYQLGEVSHGDYVSALARYLGGTTPDDAHAVHMAILRDEYPGVSELVGRLVERGTVCGCLSNTNASHWEAFFDGQRYRFGPLLKVRIGSHIERAHKPDERIYRSFERAAQASGHEIAYFDDAPQNIEAALRLGWQAHLVDPGADTADQVRGALGL